MAPLATVRASIRMLAGVLLAVMIASQLASAAHFMWIRHVRCVEHGELVHAGVDVAHGSHDDLPSTASRAIAARSTGEPASHDSDHCGAPASLEKRALIATTAMLELARAATAEAIVVLETFSGDSIALLDLAPKSSPPRIA